MRSRRTLEDCSSSNGPKALRIHAESDTEGCERLSERASRAGCVCLCQGEDKGSTRFFLHVCAGCLSDAESQSVWRNMPRSPSHT